MQLLLRSVLLSVLALSSFADKAFADDTIKGVYGDLKPFWDKGAKLNDYGVNAVFVRSTAITEDLVARARREGCRVFAEFPTLNGGHGKWVENIPMPIRSMTRATPRARRPGSWASARPTSPFARRA